MKLHQKAIRVLAVGSLVALSITAVAAATTSSTGPTYSACSTKSHQLTVMVSGKCPTGSHKVSIGARGASGVQGAAGAKGAAGAASAAGAAGAAGAKGATGAQGLPGSTYYHQTVATAGASANNPNVVTLATVGPFTVYGWCYIDASIGSPTFGDTYAQTEVTTSQDHSALDDYHQSGNSNWLAANEYPVGYAAYSASGLPSFTGPNDGSTAMESADGNTFVNLFAGTGVYVGVAANPAAPACTFFGTFTHN